MDLHSSECCKIPKTDREFLVAKIRRNKERDKEEQKKLAAMGWHCITVWECELKPSKREETLEAKAAQGGLREFPQYFLYYQENRQMSTTRWTDRIASSSGDWSGNIFDFVYKVVPKLTADLKVPFVLKGMQRVDDTPVHKIIREVVTNSCAHAYFYGRRGKARTGSPFPTQAVCE